MTNDPLSLSKQDYAELLAQISSPESPVGIDAQYTHAVIIEYLRRISERLDRLESKLG